MPVTLLTGGARSGKSALAVRLAAEAPAVTFIATAEDRDDEMGKRIARHRDQRPATWGLLEEPHDLEGALRSVALDDVVIVDCLTVWTANLLERGLDDDAILQRTSCAAEAAADRRGRTIVVTNEVGDGVVPANDLARRFRDVMGLVNRAWSTVATDAFLVIAGRCLRLEAAGGC
jgi:adenosyl cobinamide kinase/adenosyl cobinamide phosphate guanylyltransferase